MEAKKIYVTDFRRYIDPSHGYSVCIKKMSRATSDVDLADFLNVDFFYNNEYRLIFFVQIDITFREVMLCKCTFYLT